MDSKTPKWKTRLVKGEFPDRSCAVEFLVVGGYAVMKYTEPRFTKDIGHLLAKRRKIPRECSKR